jgi:uncharacterized protein DUF6924
MPTLPDDRWPLLVRTDFSSEDAWQGVSDEAQREYGPDKFSAAVEPYSDSAWDGATWEAVKAAAPTSDFGPCVLFIADSTTCTSAEHPILVVDLQDKYLPLDEFPEVAGRTPFRCIPSALWAVENNLSLANLDWDDFAGSVDEDGVLRGFGEF